MLHDRQLGFMQAVLGKAATTLNIRENRLTSAERIAIYRHHVLATLSGALGDIFPTAKAMMDDIRFNEAAILFIQQTPSTSGDLNQFGREWPAFLRDHSVRQEIAEMARLDWAWHEAFHEAESESLDLLRLGALPPEQHADLVFKLHPSARMIESPHPLMQIWLTYQPELDAASQHTPGQAVGHVVSHRADQKANGDLLIIHRGDADVSITKLAEAEYRFLVLCAKQKKLGEAAEAAFQIDAEFDLQGFLMHAVQQNIIVDFSNVPITSAHR